jgi:adenylate kinase family enzyme
MARILVIGCPGAGKSTLARRIAESLALPLVHLDREFWLPGWAEPSREIWQSTVEELASRPAWVMDGDFPSTMEVRLRRATHVIWLDFALWRCVARVLRRIARHYGRVRPDMAPGCAERLDWPFLKYVWDYKRDCRPTVAAFAAALRPDQTRILLRSPAAVRRFEEGLPATLGLA